MSNAQGFTLLLAGRPDSGIQVFASEVRARLAQRGLRVKLRASDAEELRPAGDGVERIARECLATAAGSVVNVLTCEGVEPAALNDLRRAMPESVSILVGAEGAGAADEDHDLSFHGGSESLTEGVNRLLALLEGRGLIVAPDTDAQRDEQLLIERLTDLGYL